MVHRGCELPESLWYDVERDVWLRREADGSLTLGMTDPAQTRSGKLLHIQFKRVGRHVEAGQSLATVETYGAGWIARLSPDAWAPESTGLVTGPPAIAAYTARIEALALSCFRCAD